MLSLILANKILSLFVIMALGFALVRSGIMKSKGCYGLSVVSLNIISPCMIITAFQVDLTPEVQSGFLLALLAGLIVQVMFSILAWLFGRIFHFDAVEKTAAIYSNAGNLIIPLVTAILGPEWVIYCTAYMCFQTLFMWSHGKCLLQNKPLSLRGTDWRGILTGVNMVSVYVGLALFVTGLRLPGPIYDGVSMVGNLIGPVAMLITGIIMGGLDFRQLRSYKRIALPVTFRMVVFPLCALAVLKFTPLAALSPNGTSVLLITLLAAAGPTASTINQMAQIYDCNAGYASSINVITTLLCVATMPLMVALYEL